jgi:hypothetical protein
MTATAATPLLLSITSFIEQHSRWALLTMFLLLPDRAQDRETGGRDGDWM